MYSGRGTSAVRRAHSILLLIEDDPALSLTQLAKLLNLSPSRVEHLIKSGTGNNFRKSRAAARLQKGVALLQHTALSIKQVAHSVGYSHSSTFTKQFRMAFGATPSDFRSGLS